MNAIMAGASPQPFRGGPGGSGGTDGEGRSGGVRIPGTAGTSQCPQKRHIFASLGMRSPQTGHGFLSDAPADATCVGGGAGGVADVLASDETGIVTGRPQRGHFNVRPASLSLPVRGARQ